MQKGEGGGGGGLGVTCRLPLVRYKSKHRARSQLPVAVRISPLLSHRGLLEQMRLSKRCKYRYLVCTFDSSFLGKPSKPCTNGLPAK
ncbi:hypothetical protein HanRHA438_Chr09g0401531 [Helianthus annuus]|nr:hypothetical protein HanRHA438_Chr09g0401531 [Helianthus annuus]